MLYIFLASSLCVSIVFLCFCPRGFFYFGIYFSVYLCLLDYQSCYRRMLRNSVICQLFQWGCTALIRAAMHGSADCARLLIDAGADKNAKDNVRVSVTIVLLMPSLAH